MTNERKTFTVAEVAFIFEVTSATVYNWIKAGKLPEEITAEAVQALVAERQAEADRARNRFQLAEAGAALAA